MKTFDHISPERLAELLDGFPRARIAVVGDFFLDKYLEVDPLLAEPSLETGKPAHQVVGIRHSPGAAGTVVGNLAALEAGELWAVGFTGDDGESYELRKDLAALGCHADHLHVVSQRHTPAYLKPRDKGDPTLAAEHSRYDIKNRQPTPAAVEDAVIGSVQSLMAHVNAVIIADQVEEADCGAITNAVRRALGQLAVAHPQIVFWADSRPHIREFRHVTIKPNQFEALGWENPRPDAVVELSHLVAALAALRRQIDAPVCVTCGEQGMLVSDPEPTFVPAVRVEGPLDPTGAGDSATAGAVLALCAGATLPEAALVGNLVASITIEQLATTGTASRQQLVARLGQWLDQRRPRRPAPAAC